MHGKRPVAGRFSWANVAKGRSISKNNFYFFHGKPGGTNFCDFSEWAAGKS